MKGVRGERTMIPMAMAARWWDQGCQLVEEL